MTGTILSYKGYSARIEYSAEDGCLVGHVPGIRDRIDCEGETLDEAERDFHNAVDSYLDACATWGKKPDAPDCAGLRIELPAAAYDRLSRNAEVSGQSIDQLVVEAVLAAYPEKTAPGATRNRKGSKPRRSGKRAELVG